jgi:hypothetical protein
LAKAILAPREGSHPGEKSPTLTWVWRGKNRRERFGAGEGGSLVLNRQIRVAELDAAGLGGCQAGLGAIGNHATFLLCESRVNVQRKRIDDL